MLLASKDGIRCDKCKKSYKNQFKYFSFDFLELHVFNNIVPKIDYNSKPKASFDICETCNNELSAIVISNYKPTKKDKNGSFSNGIICELSGDKMSGNYVMYNIVVTGVDVVIEKDSSEGNTATNPRVYEITVGEQIFTRFQKYKQENSINEELKKWH